MALFFECLPNGCRAVVNSLFHRGLREATVPDGCRSRLSAMAFRLARDVRTLCRPAGARGMGGTKVTQGWRPGLWPDAPSGAGGRPAADGGGTRPTSQDVVVEILVSEELQHAHELRRASSRARIDAVSGNRASFSRRTASLWRRRSAR